MVKPAFRIDFPFVSDVRVKKLNSTLRTIDCIREIHDLSDKKVGRNCVYRNKHKHSEENVQKAKTSFMPASETICWYNYFEIFKNVQMLVQMFQYFDTVIKM